MDPNTVIGSNQIGSNTTDIGSNQNGSDINDIASYLIGSKITSDPSAPPPRRLLIGPSSPLRLLPGASSPAPLNQHLILVELSSAPYQRLFVASSSDSDGDGADDHDHHHDHHYQCSDDGSYTMLLMKMSKTFSKLIKKCES